MNRGQATIPILAAGVLILLAASAVGILGAAHAAAARAQRAADLAAVSAGRALVSALGEPRAGDAVWLRERVRAAAEASAASAGGGVRTVDAPPGSAWPPVAVDVEVALPGPLGTVATARARAGLEITAAISGEPVTMARGGGYTGPLVHRDGKPMCPAVAGAFDLMDAAARADGIDLVVNSGFRSDAEQAVLFARNPDPRWVAPPGRSRHRDATELDISTHGGAGEWLARNAGRFGFLQRYSWEPWHYGYLPGCGAATHVPTRVTTAVALGGLPAWVPQRYRELITISAVGNGVPPLVLAALLQAESAYRPDAVSPAGALGIAQFMPATAAGMGLRDPFDPDQAIPAAGRLLGGHIRAFGSIPLALAAYNAGPGAVRRYGGVPPYAETRAYIARIMALTGGVAALGPGTQASGVVLLPVTA